MIEGVNYMKKYKKLVAILSMLGVIGVTGVVYAQSQKTPAEIAAGLTGKTMEEVSKERASGRTYGEISKEAGKLDEFKAQMLIEKKAILDQRVKDGKLTQEKADEIYNAIKNNQSTCDGTSKAGIGKKLGAGFGQGSGMGKGQGNGERDGSGSGCGMGACQK